MGWIVKKLNGRANTHMHLLQKPIARGWTAPTLFLILKPAKSSFFHAPTLNIRMITWPSFIVIMWVSWKRIEEKGVEKVIFIYMQARSCYFVSESLNPIRLYEFFKRSSRLYPKSLSQLWKFMGKLDLLQASLQNLWNYHLIDWSIETTCDPLTKFNQYRISN